MTVEEFSAMVDTVLVVLDLNHQIVEENLQPLLIYICCCNERLLQSEVVRCTEKIVTVYSKLRQLEVLIREFFEIIHMRPKEMVTIIMVFSCA